MTGATRRGRHLVSIDDRLRYLRVLRAVVAAAAVLDATLLRHGLRGGLAVVVGVAVGYLGGCLAVEALWRSRRRGVRLFGSLLMFDGAFLAWASYATGGTAGPLRYLVLVHLGAVTLLTSGRTGAMLAAWDSALQVGVWAAARAGAGVGDAAVAREMAQWQRLVAFVIALWVLTAAISILATVSERELRRRRFELERLARMGRALEDAHDPLSVADVLLDALGETFGFRRMALFDVVEGVPRLLTCRNLVDGKVADFDVRSGSLLAVAHDERRSLVVDRLDPTVDPWLAAVMPGARNVVVVPLVADAVTGVLVAEASMRERGPVEPRVVATTERFAGHCALAMRNANLLERVQQMAVTDGLTELANRRSLDRALERELQRAARTDGRLSVVLLDIDHFKRLNDTHGHLVGDTVLRQVAAALRESGRDYDTIARYGGEEFAAVLPGCSSALALQVAERLRRAIEQAPTDVPVTASAGVATFPYDGPDVAALLAAADRALYAAKHAGRNRVRSASPVGKAKPAAS